MCVGGARTVEHPCVWVEPAVGYASACASAQLCRQAERARRMGVGRVACSRGRTRGARGRACIACIMACMHLQLRSGANFHMILHGVVLSNNRVRWVECDGCELRQKIFYILQIWKLILTTSWLPDSDATTNVEFLHDS